MRLSEPQLSALLRRNPELAIGPHSIYGLSEDAPPILPLRSDAPQTEEQLQMALIEFCHERGQADPIWLEVFHPATGGHRHKATAGRLKAMGCRKGVLDLCWLIARGGYHGFALELKMPGGRLTPEQRLEITRLTSHGFWAGVAWTLPEATTYMEAYYSLV